jgi:hypothetical protein
LTEYATLRCNKMNENERKRVEMADPAVLCPNSLAVLE